MEALPWSKYEIIAAVRAEYRPFNLDDRDSWPILITARVLGRLSLSRSQRAAPHQEDALCRLTARILEALKEGHDPSLAYDVPLDDEAPLTPDRQLSRSYRDMATILNEARERLRPSEDQR